MHERLIGVDEAGLGPLLGPFCLAAFCTTRSWKTPVKDSKKLHKKENLYPLISACGVYLPGFDVKIFREIPVDLFGFEPEPWFLGASKRNAELKNVNLGPQKISPEKSMGDTLFCLSAGVSAFNESLQITGNKSETTAQYLTQIVKLVVADSKDYDRLTFWIDRLGGRKHYAPLVESWGMTVNTHDESPDLSRYRGHLHGKPCEVNFAVKADATHHPVAAASCFAKLRREIAMEQFNRWWKENVPDLRNTAGYWEDGLRFLSEVENFRSSLNINLDTLRRNK